MAVLFLQMNIPRVEVQVLYYHKAEHHTTENTLFEDFSAIAGEAIFYAKRPDKDAPQLM
jgi:hypothetical protein